VGGGGEVRLVGDTRGLAPLGTRAQCNGFEVAVVDERVDDCIEVTTDLGVAMTLELGEHLLLVHDCPLFVASVARLLDEQDARRGERPREPERWHAVGERAAA
jgi:hypothetical protein